MLNETELKRQIWHSRRGMLELDVLLGPFALHVLPLISAGEQQVYVRLLRARPRLVCLVYGLWR